jgi:hypothetical protein
LEKGKEGEDRKRTKKKKYRKEKNLVEEPFHQHGMRISVSPRCNTNSLLISKICDTKK